MSFKIIVDSCCDLSPELLRSGIFHSVPLTIYVGENEFRDDDTLVPQTLVDAMAMCQEASHTACPSPADYLDAFEAVDGDIYVVTLSALLSGSHNSAWQAAQMFVEEHPERNIRVFNSCSASAGETLIALKISELASSGMPFAQVVAQVEKYITEMNTLFVLENLDMLRKAGRLTRVQSLVTGALRVKLVMGSTPQGEIKKHTQALSIKQALNKLADIVAADENHKGKLLCIAHCLCRERAEYLRMMILKTCEVSDVLITETRGISSFYANNGGVVVAY
ncbi:dihydroxyacetone kinase [Pseudoflavonifractor sp. An176]|uniref:DegV family protein n=1 Tax=Pseudoflavonifractor sp. An176 TaxID=1965572 RepID=UPI000B39FF74|nr:DegV family protein [Pseudoflavonifractor sp. An176]OUP65606.1 dihydroxyacetone kinase [Pseudoflavonifractor sp. An176]